MMLNEFKVLRLLSNFISSYPPTQTQQIFKVVLPGKKTLSDFINVNSSNILSFTSMILVHVPSNQTANK